MSGSWCRIEILYRVSSRVLNVTFRGSFNWYPTVTLRQSAASAGHVTWLPAVNERSQLKTVS